MTITNFSTAIFLVNPDAKAVLCSYEQDPVNGKGKEPFILYKSLDPDLAAEGRGRCLTCSMNQSSCCASRCTNHGPA